MVCMILENYQQKNDKIHSLQVVISFLIVVTNGVSLSINIPNKIAQALTYFSLGLFITKIRGM